MTQLGSIEAGGTKFIVARGDEQGILKKYSGSKQPIQVRQFQNAFCFFKSPPWQHYQLAPLGLLI